MPYLGDWCIVDMLRGDLLERVAVAHADPEAQAAAYEFLKRFPITPDAAHGPGFVIASGRAELISEVTDEHLQRASGGDPEYLEALRADRDDFLDVRAADRPRPRAGDDHDALGTARAAL